MWRNHTVSRRRRICGRNYWFIRFTCNACLNTCGCAKCARERKIEKLESDEKVINNTYTNSARNRSLREKRGFSEIESSAYKSAVRNGHGNSPGQPNKRWLKDNETTLFDTLLHAADSLGYLVAVSTSNSAYEGARRVNEKQHNIKDEEKEDEVLEDVRRKRNAGQLAQPRTPKRKKTGIELDTSKVVQGSSCTGKCQLCQVSYTSEQSRESHETGETHQNNAKRRELMTRYGLFCHVCKHNLTRQTRVAHFESKKHKKKEAEIQRMKDEAERDAVMEAKQEAEPKSDTEEGGSPAMSSRKAPASPQSPFGPSLKPVPDHLDTHMCRSITSSIKANHLDCADRLLNACPTVARKLELIHAIDTATNTVESPLHVACMYGNLPFVQFLISNNANVNTPNRDSYTALHRAAQADQPDICKYLIEHKSDPAAESKNYTTPKHVAKGSALRFLFTITPPPQTAEQQEHQPQEQHEQQEQMPQPPPPPPPPPQHHPQHRQSPRPPQRPMGSPGGSPPGGYPPYQGGYEYQHGYPSYGYPPYPPPGYRGVGRGWRG